MTPFSLRHVPALDCLASLRNQYLDACPEAQELYLELKVRVSKAQVIEADGQAAGYVLIGPDGTLLEYFLVPEFMRCAEAWFGEIRRRCAIRKGSSAVRCWQASTCSPA